MKLFPIILSGGSGSRLWPLSREHYPKPLLPLTSERSLLQDTATRLDALPEVGNAVYVCNEEHRFLVAEQVAALGKTPETIILEPEGRNTAPALTLAALYLARSAPDSLMVVMPADHVITEREAFLEAVRKGAGPAVAGSLVTFGVVPDGHRRPGMAISSAVANSKEARLLAWRASWRSRIWKPLPAMWAKVTITGTAGFS